MTPAQRRILELTKRKPRTFSELRRDTGLTDAGLYKALQSLEKGGYIQKKDLGYTITTKGLNAIEREKVFRQGSITVFYEGVSEEKVKEICKALSDEEGKFYIHAFREDNPSEIDEILGLSILVPELLDNK